MNTFDIIVTRYCSVIEKMKITVEAEDEDEAQDAAYEIASEFPEPTLQCNRVVVSSREYKDIGDIETLVLPVRVVEGPKSA